jgi:Mn2+/Fe2+ NRAMP family transporter
MPASIAGARQHAPTRTSVLRRLGPGLVTGAADDDPSGIATYSQAGAQFGFGMLWTLVLTFPLMSAVQLISARIGRVTGCGLAKNIAQVLPRPAVHVLVALLFAANTINIGANLAVMGATAEIVTQMGRHACTIAFAVVSLALQLFLPYERYAGYLKWLTLVLFAYVAVLFTVHVDWYAAVTHLVWPRFPTTSAAFTMIVAILGTTISPYLLFWQSSQEVEEIENRAAVRPLLDAPGRGPAELRRIRVDTLAGMGLSNLVALAIMICTAVTLHSKGMVDIASAEQAAEALRPVAGDFAFGLFSLGIIGTGFLSVPVLAGSAAYAFGEVCGWKCGLQNKPQEAVGFYSVIVLATLLGIGIGFSSIEPMKALVWSAVINGVVAVPILAAMTYVARRRQTMGRFTLPGTTAALGWGTAAVMFVASALMLIG